MEAPALRGQQVLQVLRAFLALRVPKDLRVPMARPVKQAHQGLRVPKVLPDFREIVVPKVPWVLKV